VFPFFLPPYFPGVFTAPVPFEVVAVPGGGVAPLVGGVAPPVGGVVSPVGGVAPPAGGLAVSEPVESGSFDLKFPSQYKKCHILT
jgi:hypothetical protein